MPDNKLIIIAIVFLCSCNQQENSSQLRSATVNERKDSIYTPYSELKNSSIGFNSPDAINAIAKMENEYFNDYNYDVSKYYGTIWYESTLYRLDFESGNTVWDEYLRKMKSKNLKPYSMHCTLYAIKALKAGLGNDFEKLQKLHQQRWGNREFAGWSVAYLLTTYFNWKAFLIIDEYSDEYKRCIKYYKNSKSYFVWRQPGIKLQKMLIFGKDNDQIDSLLAKNEFGWGFSNQGIHTWITRFNQLKECRWEGAPSKKYDICENCSPLFLTHQFMEFKDYASHIVVFPPQIE